MLVSTAAMVVVRWIFVLASSALVGDMVFEMAGLLVMMSAVAWRGGFSCLRLRLVGGLAMVLVAVAVTPSIICSIKASKV